MSNLVKTKAKERTKSRALAGMGIGAAASLLIQGLRGNLNDGKAGKVEISYSDIVKAITDHDNNYK
jgi:hypothetical protein